MKQYEKPMAKNVTLSGTDVILTSPVVTLQNGGTPTIQSLKSFNWNE